MSSSSNINVHRNFITAGIEYNDEHDWVQVTLSDGYNTFSLRVSKENDAYAHVYAAVKKSLSNVSATSPIVVMLTDLRGVRTYNSMSLGYFASVDTQVKSQHCCNTTRANAHVLCSGCTITP